MVVTLIFQIALHISNLLGFWTSGNFGLGQSSDIFWKSGPPSHKFLGVVSWTYCFCAKICLFCEGTDISSLIWVEFFCSSPNLFGTNGLNNLLSLSLSNRGHSCYHSRIPYLRYQCHLPGQLAMPNSVSMLHPWVPI